MKHLLLALILVPSLTFARVELFQIVVFNWDTERKVLQLQSLGSGTAVDNNLILTNKHVVETSPGKFADFLLLCQARENQASVNCNIPAGVAAVHENEDVALVKPLEAGFYPKVKFSTSRQRPGEQVRVFGFPTPSGRVGFGDTRTLSAFREWAKDPSRPLDIKGDAITITRGKVQARLENTKTGFKYTLTDAKANFGNSGGAAFDEFAAYLGIVTLKDSNDNAIFLEYGQIHDWVWDNREATPTFSDGAYKFYKDTQNPQNFQRARRATTRRTVSSQPRSSRSAIRERLRQRIEARRNTRLGRVKTQARSREEVRAKLREYFRQKRLAQSRG